MRGDGTQVSYTCVLVGWDRKIRDEARYLRKMVDVIIIDYLEGKRVELGFSITQGMDVLLLRAR